ncbi:MAG: hypothetical protein J7641_06790 [Cyanobacteria bacterium SID2]|nr:hypothetical protein [Cyanobacteria bacterium SID2]MBP0004712.1 hypothetical protein [Cyanobacteria bacterium SBC]
MKFLEQTANRLVCECYPTLSRIASIFLAVFGISTLSIPTTSSDERTVSIVLVIAIFLVSIFTLLPNKKCKWIFDKERSKFTVERKIFFKKEAIEQRLQDIQKLKIVSAPQHEDDLFDNRFGLEIRMKDGTRFNLCSDRSLSEFVAREALYKISRFLNLDA